VLNRAEIFAAIEQQIALGTEDSAGFAVLTVRVCGLRDIAIRFGFDRGEKAEESAGQLIRESLRPVDLVFRAGDETFAVILPGLRTQNHALLAATRLAKAFDQPLNRETSPWQGRCVMGVVFHPQHGNDADALWRRAETAVDDAQLRGEHCVFYELGETRVEIGYHDLRESIESNKLRVYFQPIWDLKTSQLVGAESLARWTSQTQGEVRPSDFVPYAEQSDLISALTRWSINSTFRHAGTLQGAGDFAFAINLSPRVFSRPGLTEQLMDALSIWEVPPTSVIAEVTETALVNDLNLTVQVLRRLRDKGMRIAIDDFGTGYASISYLSKFPATDLKIDKSLIAGVGSDPRIAKLVHAIVELAHHMNLAVTAEGIEDEATQKMLTDIDCDYGQGYHLGLPEPAADFVTKFASKR
jgi:diguanylate cyclase (GGDEF)-like protein